MVTLRTKLKSDPPEGGAPVHAHHGLGILQLDWENISGLARFALRKRTVSARELERWASGDDAKLVDSLNRRFDFVQARRTQTSSDVFAVGGPSPAQVP